MKEEAEKSNSKVVRVAEQLEAAQVANTEKEDELKRIKVQCDQWRKACRGNCCCVFGRGTVARSKNGNVLKKIGVLWKKSQKISG
ncbi:interactor of constitutive active ROPs protein, putative [Medicago truncatula]|uniref:Interactor of constitutive active ROPs protein, putative n=1 Tax=Medicago truncatula TaxID=3880 RepID=G7IU53_MEDTR|nr:interactor of constitutive active ROPs protein, putative [Medicago truncatula]